MEKIVFENEKIINLLKEDKKLILNGNIKLEYQLNQKKGTIRYYGKLENDKEDKIWIGVEWDEEGLGKNDGEAFGKRYFETKKNSATFIHLEKVLKFCSLSIEGTLKIKKRKK
jgi:dynactin complex subunit